MRYPLTKELTEAIDKLFDSRSTAEGFIGALDGMSAKAGFDEPFSPNANPGQRALMLRKKLEGYIVQMAAESEELSDENETIRLRTESIGILIALRELWLHFPEAFQPPSM
jgi:hypothetical protein